MRTWDFTDEETGEPFFIEAPTREEAIKKAKVIYKESKGYL